MKLSTIQTNMVRAGVMIAGLSLAISSKATVPISDLPDFDNLPSFTMLGNNILLHNGTANGNVGVSAGGSITKMAPTTINGNLYLGSGVGNSGPGTVVGTTFTGVDLSTEQSTVFSASSAMAGLTPDVTYSSSQSGSFTYDVPAGEVYVVDFNGGLSLSGGNNISLTGGGDLLLNVMGSLGISGSTTGIFGDASDIFINRLGTSSVSTSGGPTINAQYFTPYAAITLNGGTMNGALYGGNAQLQLHSGATLNGIPLPEPGAVALMGAGFACMYLARRRLGSLKMQSERSI